jgi:AcrR family transcriptional regulator
MAAAAVPTRERILAVAMVQFGTRGYEATSLDAIAGEAGLRKQTILYWFASKEALLDAVVAQSAHALSDALEAALRAAPSRADRVDVVMRTVFRFAVRTPALLGVVREVNRLGPDVAGALFERLRPLVDSAAAFLAAEMEAGTIRQGDPRLLLLFTYATVVGVATEVEAQRAVGLASSPSSLRRLRRELFAYVRAAVQANLPAMVPAERRAEPSAPSVV